MKTNYLAHYGTRRYQGGGEMPAPAGPEGGMPQEGGAPPQEGGGGDPQAEILAMAQAAAQGDQAAAAQLGMALAPMILEQAGQGGAPEGGGGPAPAEGGAPVFRRGGRLA
ncbi:MAG: hypothetical protein KAH32_00470 [Chlamydiia bacterium]|nr:hypothetical protein [Chlamydiia bacterium]